MSTNEDRPRQKRKRAHHIYKRGAYWYVDIEQDGKRTRRSLGTTVLSVAKERRDAYLAGKAQLRWGTSDLDITTGEFWTKYLEWAELHKQPRTVEREASDWNAFLAYLSPATLGAVTNGDVERFKSHLSRKWSNRSINDALTRLSALYTRATKQGWYQRGNPFKGVERLPVDTRKVKYLTREQIDRVMLEAAKHSKNAELFFGLCIFAGMRTIEAVNSRWEWFSFEERCITIQSERDRDFGTKNKKHRSVPMAQRLADILTKHREADGYLLVSDKASKGKWRLRYEPKRAFKSVVTAAGVGDWCTPHVLRHTFASRLVQENVDLFTVGAWMGHSDPRTTAIYAHLKPHDERIDLI